MLLYTHCIDNHPKDSETELCICDFDVMSHAPERESYWKDWTRNQFEWAQREKGKLLAEKFRHPKYKRVNGQPVVYRGNADSLLYYEERFGVSPSRTLALQMDGAYEPIYFVATNCDPKYYDDLKGWGFSAVTEYLEYSDSWEHVAAHYRNVWERGIETARRTGIKYWVPVTTGFDSRAWYDHPSRFIPTPEQFTTHVREAKEFASKHFIFTDGHVQVEAWNEYGEGSVLEPMQYGSLHNGDEMLRAFRAA
jgi:hypothetical protein